MSRDSGTIEKFVPVVQSEVFKAQPNADFAIVNLGHGLYPLSSEEELFEGYLKLRKNVYVDMRSLLPSSVENPDGTEFDEDDERSQHFAVVKNLAGRVAVVACLRGIHKNDNKPLPVEGMFPEAFTDGGLPEKSLEISRLISLADDRSANLRVIGALFGSMLAHNEKNGLGPVYGVVERNLEQSLSFLGAPTKRIAEPKMVDSYNSENLAIQIDLDKMRQQVGAKAINFMMMEDGGSIFWGDNAEMFKGERQ